MKFYSNQFPTWLKNEPPKPHIGTLWYTYPATGEKKPMTDYINIPFAQLQIGINTLVQHGYIRKNFDIKYRDH